MSPKSIEKSKSPNNPLPNLKARVSDENLNNSVEQVSEDEKAPVELRSFDNQRKRSLVSLSEEVESEEQFLFLRLRKQIKSHWNKLVERYPNGNLFHRTPQAEHKTNESADPENPEIVRTDSNRSSTSTTSADALPSILSSQIKSVFLLPAFSCKRDDEGRRGVPFISCLLEVSVETEIGDKMGELFSPNPLFAISCKYGPVEWIVHRKLMDIFKLHTLTIIRELQGFLCFKLALPAFPNQFSYLLDASLLATIKRDVRTEQQPKLLEERRLAIETYLQKLLLALNLQVSPELCEFFEFSGLSPLTRIGSKGKEGYLKNRIFDIQLKKSCCWRMLTCWIPQRRHYKTKWFVLRPSYLAYLDHIDQTQPSDVLLFDRHFELEIENEGSKNLLKPLRLTIRNGSKFLEVRPENNSQMPYWITQLTEMTSQCLWTQGHRFDSFSPIRQGCHLDWLIDGQEYFSVLVRAIQAAQTEIYIHGWWLSPEVHLLRPPSLHPNFRLDRLLQARAEAGIKIYIVVYKELSLALSIDSYHTKVALEGLHPNIRVQRHPDHLAGGVLYWAHHEKIIVIDQSVAFIGGLDVAFGRYDCSNHRLVDHHPENGAATIWTGIDYSNPRIRDFRNVIQHTVPLIERSIHPRMPWHDVHCVIRGQSARDLARHFIQSWNNVKTEKAMQKNEQIPFLLPRPDYSESDETAAPSGTCRIQVVRSVGDWSMGCPTEPYFRS